MPGTHASKKRLDLDAAVVGCRDRNDEETAHYDRHLPQLFLIPETPTRDPDICATDAGGDPYASDKIPSVT